MSNHNKRFGKEIRDLPLLCSLISAKAASHARSQAVLSGRGGGSNVDSGFFVDEEGRGTNQISLQAGHLRPASETPFDWRFAGVPMMAKH